MIHFARASSHIIINDFNAGIKFLTAKLLKQSYWYFNIRKAFPEVNRRHRELVGQYHVNPKLYVDLVYELKKSIGIPNFSDIFKRIIFFQKVGYS